VSDSAPPGWYPDGTGGQRYWDGSRWLQAPPAGPPPSGPPPAGPPPGPRSWADAAYTPPPGPPPRKSRAALWAVLGVVGVVLVAALVTTLVLVTGGDDETAPSASGHSSAGSDDPGPTDDPETTEPSEEPDGDPAATVQAFIDAALDGDCAAIEDLVTDDFLDESGDCSSADFDPSTLEGVELEVGDTDVDGDTATVQLVSTYEGQTAEVGLELVYEDDTWLIDGTDLPDAPEPPSASAPTLPSPS